MVCSDAERSRCVFFFSIMGDLRFISHKDTLRMFHRMFARADLPVRFSTGFNPHPRISVVLPRPVGVASEAEAVEIRFEQPVDLADVLRRLAERSPAGLRWLSGERLEMGERLRAESVRYRLEPTDSGCQGLPDRVRELVAAKALPVERRSAKDGKCRVVDIRPYIVDCAFEDDAVGFTLRVTPGGSARPAEVAGLLGFEARMVNHRIRRVEIQWERVR